MKKYLFTLIISAFGLFAFAQPTDTSAVDHSNYRIIKTDGAEIIAKILSQNAREIYILTEDGRKIYIPQHLVKEIILLKSRDFNAAGEYVGEDKFATRYFITTNGLPIKKGESYVKYGLAGPEIQFGVGKNVGVGLITSWIGAPIIATVKKSWEINSTTQVAVGALVGSASWALIDAGGVLPYGTISFGDRRRNLAITAGYGALFFEGDVTGGALTSLAGMIKLSTKISFIFDSVILLPGSTETSTTDFNPNTGTFQNNTIREYRPGVGLITPGLRWHQSEGKAFQFGFTAIATQGEVIPFIPSISWLRTL